MNVDDILARIDSEQPPTYTEMGVLLPELEQRNVLIADTPEYCHGKRLACFYQFRGQQFLWICAHVGYGQAGKVKVPAAAVSTAYLPVGIVALTTCKRCGHGYLLANDRTHITVSKQPAPIWTEVAGPDM